MRKDLYKKFSIGCAATGGRNITGKITVRYRGGGHKRKYRLVDYVRRINSFGIVQDIFYDSYRTGFVALVYYFNGIVSFILCADNVSKGDIIYSGVRVPSNETLKFYVTSGYLRDGCTVPLGIVPVGARIFCIARYPFGRGIIARAAGTFAMVLKRFSQYSLLKLRSGMLIHVPHTCLVSLGMVSNFREIFRVRPKAGNTR